MGRGWAIWFVTTLVTSIALAACAATDEVVEAPPQPSQPSQGFQSSDRELAPGTIAALQACATDGASRLSRHSYEISFEMEATKAGEIGEVTPKGKRLDDAAVEACMIRALESMPVVDYLRTEEAFPETSQSILPPSRFLFGTTSVLPQAIRLVPVVVTAPGITIVVGVAIVVVAAIVVKMSKECQKEWQEAKQKCLDLLDSNDPPRGLTGGYLDTKECARGLVSMRCGGNRIDDDGQGARPGRRT